MAIIQARTGSTRLPGKVLLPLGGQPVLRRVIDRLRQAKRLDAIWVATTNQPGDQAVAELCRTLDIPAFAGNENDVLDRYYQAALTAQADIVVRITADCPLLDPELGDEVIKQFLAGQPGVDYAVNDGFPRGLDIEVFTRAALECTWREDKSPSGREHVTAYIYQNPDRFRVLSVRCEQDFSAERWTLDTPEDFQLIEKLWRHFGHDRFRWREAMTVLDAHPEWRELNRHTRQKTLLE